MYSIEIIRVLNNPELKNKKEAKDKNLLEEI